MDEQEKKDGKPLNESAAIGDKTQEIKTELTALAEWMKNGKEKAEPLMEHVKEVLKIFPGVTLTSWAPSFYCDPDDTAETERRREPTVALDLTGEKPAVRAFLSYVALSRGMGGVLIFERFDEKTKGTVNSPVGHFIATLNPHPAQIMQIKNMGR